MRQLNLFDTLPLDGEGPDVEYKAAKGGLPGSFWESYSAMANTGGGVVFLGVAEYAGVPMVEGVPDPATLRSQLWSQLNDRNKVSVNLLTEANINTVDVSGRKVVTVSIPRAERSQRPVHVGPNPFGGTYRRAEDGDYRCTDDEVRRMMADRSSTPADSRIVEHFGIADFDPETVKQFRNRFASRSPDHPWLAEGDEGLMLKLGACRRDRATGAAGATVAGLLVFGRDEALREALPSYHVDYRERLSIDPAVRWTDRLHPDGSWQPNLFQFYQRVIQRLTADVKIPFQLNAELERRDDSPTHEALREAVVNALIHADHNGQGGVVIERYADCIVLSNPGSLLVSRQQLLRGGVSECRNKSVQLMFQMFGRGERAGSGMDTIRQGWRTQHWRSPKIEEQVQPDRVSLVMPMVSLLPPEVEQALQARFGERFAQLSPLEVQAMVTAQLEGSVSNGRMQEITGEHPADITAMLRGLVQKRLLSQQKARRWSSYRVAEPSDSSPLGPDSTPSFAHSPPSELDSLPSIDNSPPSAASALPPTWLSPADQHLWELAAPARGRKLRRPVLDAIIAKLCQHRWLSARQLAELLERDPESLQTKVLASLVRSGQLRLRFPEVPNRRDQAYQSVEAAP